MPNWQSCGWSRCNMKSKSIPEVVAHRISLLLSLSATLLILLGCVSEPRWKEDRSISFSPDDKAIAYRHRGAIYVARARGDDHRRIYQAEEGSSVSSPRWSPNREGLAFAVSTGEANSETGKIDYSIWFWRAPQEIWESSRQKVSGKDSVALPEDWSPSKPIRIATGRCFSSVQITGDALLAWDPKGNRILFLDTNGRSRQRVVAVNLGDRKQEQVSPVESRSLAFAQNPDGRFLVCAAEDPDASMRGLWLGPLGAGMDKWERIEPNPGPRVVPSEPIFSRSESGSSQELYDLRPRLGAWSANSKRLAFIRIAASNVKTDGGRKLTEDSPGEGQKPESAIVVISINGVGKPRVFPLSGDVETGLKWSPKRLRLGFLSGNELVLLDTESGKMTNLSGAVSVQRFVGWSSEGMNIAYLTPQPQFRVSMMPLPEGHRVLWGPTERHNLIVADGDGIHPKSRFSGMNVSFARWGNKTRKLSFWATYLPSVNLLPPGDPAAVLDVEDNTIRWYPTSVEEYAQVGHYYLLNGRYADALDRYSEAFKLLETEDAESPIAGQIHLWRALCQIGSRNRREVRKELNSFRRVLVLEETESGNRPAAGNLLPELLRRNLLADRLLLASLLSMNQPVLAGQEAGRISAETSGYRALQAECFQALIDQSTSDANRFAERVTTRILPLALGSHPSAADPEAFVTRILTLLLRDSILRGMASKTRHRTIGRLLGLATAQKQSRPETSARLSSAAAVICRESGDMKGELATLSASLR